MKYCILAKNDEKSSCIKEELRKLIKFEYDEEYPQIVICVGGDGTILSAIHKYEKIIGEIIIFGIHTGSLGFFTNFKMDDYRYVSEIINNNDYLVEDFSLLSYKIKDGDSEQVGFALNEITITSHHRTLVLEVYIDNEYLESFRGTGLCMSTPYGSTAYNKSLHGAVVDPTLNSIQLTEIASINSNAYRTLGSSLVLNDKRVITLKSGLSMDVWVTADNENLLVEDLKEITVYSGGKTVNMASSKKQTFFTRVKKAFM